MVASAQPTPFPSLSDFSSESVAIAAAARQIAESPHEVPGTVLRQAYQAMRRLQALWKLDLARWELGWSQGASRPGYHRQLLPALMMELSVVEMAVRVWGTTLALRELNRQTCDATRIIRNILNSQMLVRNQLLTVMLQAPPSVAAEVSTAEHIRRRAERWTDVLISKAIGPVPFFEFAFDAERLADYASEPQVLEELPAAHAQQYLIETGLKLAFSQSVGRTPLSEPAFGLLWRAMEASSPVSQKTHPRAIRTN